MDSVKSRFELWTRFAEHLFRFWESIEGVSFDDVSFDDVSFDELSSSPRSSYGYLSASYIGEKLSFLACSMNESRVDRAFLLKAIRLISQEVFEILPRIVGRPRSEDPRYQEATELFIQEHADVVALLVIDHERLCERNGLR